MDSSEAVYSDETDAVLRLFISRFVSHIGKSAGLKLNKSSAVYVLRLKTNAPSKKSWFVACGEPITLLQILIRQSACTVKRISLELGGNAPFIVFNSANLDAAVEAAVFCKFRASGQTCICANRILVQDKIYDAFVGKMAQEIDKKLHVGHGFEKGITQGPLISKKALQKVKLWWFSKLSVCFGAKVRFK